MKFIRLIGYGNTHPHLIPLNKIVDITFKDQLTELRMFGGSLINVIASEKEITGLLERQGGEILTLKSTKGYKYPPTHHKNVEGMEYWSYDSTADIDPSK